MELLGCGCFWQMLQVVCLFCTLILVLGDSVHSHIYNLWRHDVSIHLMIKCRNVQKDKILLYYITSVRFHSIASLTPDENLNPAAVTRRPWRSAGFSPRATEAEPVSWSVPGPGAVTVRTVTWLNRTAAQEHCRGAGYITLCCTDATARRGRGTRQRSHSFGQNVRPSEERYRPSLFTWLHN